MLTFILKKLVSQLLMPLSLGIALGLIALLLIGKRRRLGTYALVFMLLLLLCFSNATISNLLVGSLESRFRPLNLSQLSEKDRSELHWIVVLGGGSAPDPRLPITSQLGTHSLFRVVEGIRLARELPDAKLILSGGNINNLPGDGSLMRQFAIASGIESQRCLEEVDSLDTIDEARVVKKMVGTEPIVLVTSALHMSRAVGLFTREGLRIIAAPTAFGSSNVPLPWWADVFPQESALYSSRLALHEYLGIFWAKLRGQL